MNGNDYYDLDAILSEEEFIPLVTQCEFSYMAHLDPDAPAEKNQHYLANHSKLKLPLWAIESWAMLGYCRCQLPRVYTNKARERFLLSNEHDTSSSLQTLPRPDYFRTGKRIADLMHQTYLKQKTSSASNQQFIDYLKSSSENLQQSLLASFVGGRFRQWLDWSWTAVGQDVSQFILKLTELEKSLFVTSVTAWSHHNQSAHKMYGRGKRRMKNSQASDTSNSDTNKRNRMS